MLDTINEVQAHHNEPKTINKKRIKELANRTKCLIGAVIFLSLIISIQLIWNYRQVSYCTTPGCVKAAALILNNMDIKTDPCDDFYQFACGRFIDTQQIPADKGLTSTLNKIMININSEMRALIERPPKPDQSDPPIVGQMRNFYASCMNLTDIEASGDRLLMDAINGLGGWPVLLGKSAAVVDWIELNGRLRRQGFVQDMIIDLWCDSTATALDFGSLGLPDRSYYLKGLNDSIVSAYYDVMVESAVMLGAERPEARRQMLEALEFETALAKLSPSFEQRQNYSSMYKTANGTELYRLAPKTDWRRYFSSMMPKFDGFDSTILDIKVTSYIAALDDLLHRTEPRVVSNYMIWRVLLSLMDSLPSRWRQLAHKFDRARTGRQIEIPRGELCVRYLEGWEPDERRNSFDAALSALYVKNHFVKDGDKSNRTVRGIFDAIQREFLEELPRNEWINADPLKMAMEKATKMGLFVGYPDELLQDEVIERFYEGLRMDPANFQTNLRRLRMWSIDYGWRMRNESRQSWTDHIKITLVNAYYSVGDNFIEIPAGIMRDLLFDLDRPAYLDYATIGHVIGHEFVHAFDGLGRQFDKDANEQLWLTPELDAKFRDRVQCLVDQFNNFTVLETGDRVDGLKTQDENIADHGGIKLAFRAYRRSTSWRRTEALLPGLANYTPDQLFWLIYANVRCAKYRPEMLRMQRNSESHAPHRFRILGPLMNSVDFARSFDCPAGESYMNPIRKCSVW